MKILLIQPKMNKRPMDTVAVVRAFDAFKPYARRARSGNLKISRRLILAARRMMISRGCPNRCAFCYNNSPDLPDIMAQTGCKSLFIGFESINTASLESVDKDNRTEKYEELVEAIHDRGIMINASMVFGLDGECGFFAARYDIARAL